MIDGYRELTQDEIYTINDIKRLANEVGEVLDGFTRWEEADQRWVAIAKTDLQKGFMALVRSVAKPEGF
jgi:hypothetical protein